MSGGEFRPREWPEYDEGRRAFVAMLTATLHGDLLSCARVMTGMDRNTMMSALSAALGTLAGTVADSCKEHGLPVDEYCAELGLIAARGQ